MTETYETTLQIDAAPEDVFDHFVKPELMVQWMGDFARLEAKAGGLFSVDINGVLIRGSYLALDRPRLIEIAWGEAGNGKMPPGATRLRIRLEAKDGGTLLSLEHSGLELSEAGKHAIGWPHFLERLAIATAGGKPGIDPWASEAPTRGPD